MFRSEGDCEREFVRDVSPPVTFAFSPFALTSPFQIHFASDYKDVFKVAFPEN